MALEGEVSFRAIGHCREGRIKGLPAQVVQVNPGGNKEEGVDAEAQDAAP
jgi:hypothetical protein